MDATTDERHIPQRHIDAIQQRLDEYNTGPGFTSLRAASAERNPTLAVDRRAPELTPWPLAATLDIVVLAPRSSRRFSLRLAAEEVKDPPRAAQRIIDAQRPHPKGPEPGARECESLNAPLVGVRAMSYEPETGELHSLKFGYSGSWRASPLRMHCPRGHTEPRLQGCECGLYAQNSYADFGSPDDVFLRSPRYIRCVVKATGAIVEGEYGFAAQRMEPIAVVFDHGPLDYYGLKIDLLPAFESVASKLALPLIATEDIPDFARIHGVYAADRACKRADDEHHRSRLTALPRRLFQYPPKASRTAAAPTDPSGHAPGSST